jgi:hypothetical protein
MKVCRWSLKDDRLLVMRCLADPLSSAKNLASIESLRALAEIVVQSLRSAAREQASRVSPPPKLSSHA